MKATAMILRHVKFANVPVGAQFISLSHVGTFTKTHDNVAERDVEGMHKSVGFFDHELVAVDAKAIEPQMPLHADFLDHMGYVDYEAYDYAMEQYRDSHDAWYEQYGKKEAEIVLAWTAREKQLYAGPGF